MDKVKNGRPFGTFKGKEKKVTTSVGIEPRFRRAIIERYASFQEWFDAQVHKEFQGEELPVLDEGSTKVERQLSNLEIHSVSLVPTDQVVDPGPMITKQTLEDGAQQLRDDSAIPRHPVPQGIIRIGKPATEEQIAEARHQWEVNTGPVLPANNVPVTDENGDRIGEASIDLVVNPHGPPPPGFEGIPPGAILPKSVTDKLDDELDALEGEDQSNLDPFNQL